MEEQSELIDRISALPELVIHHLLSFLSSKDIKVTSVLSKKWYDICLSAPFLEFDDSRFAEDSGIYSKSYPTTEEARRKFVNLVSETLTRFQKNNLRITRFKIRVILIHPRLVQLLDGWIRLVLDQGVEELDLDTRNRGDIFPYNVPQGVIFAKSIKKANLALCSFLQSFPRNDIIDSRNSQLQKLCLDKVHMDEHSLRSIISIYPLIEELSISACPGIKKVQISHLRKLKSLFIFSWRRDDIQWVEIDAPSLQSFKLNVLDNVRPRRISMLECPCLMNLCLDSVDVEDGWLQNLVSRLSSLRKLVLGHCKLLQMLKISSDSLNSLEIYKCKNLIQLEIDAPNLLSFHLTDETTPKLLISSMHPISQWEVILLFRGKDPLLLDTEFFFRLRNFISHSNQFGHLHVVLYDNEVTFNVEESKDRADQPVAEIKHLTLQDVPPLSYPNILNGLLWTCHPHIMSFLLEPKERNDAVTFVRDILGHRDCVGCCSCRHARSWLKHLQDVSVVSVEGAEKQWLVNGNMRKYSLKSASSREIIFKFKW